MNAALLESPKNISFAPLQWLPLKPDEVRVKLKMTGICGSDVHLFLGHRTLSKPIIIGHEGLGYVYELGENVHHLHVGDRVVIEPNIPCTICRICTSGRGNICNDKKVIGLNIPGCFAEYVTTKADYVWKINNTITDADAVTIEPTAVAVHAISICAAKKGDTIAVIGLGAIGLLLSHVALAMGYNVLVTEKNKSKVKLAVEQGAIDACDGMEVNESTLHAQWERHHVISVFECAGTGATVSLAIAAAPRGSEVILLGLATDLAVFQPLKIVREGITILPSLIYNHPADFERTIQLIEAGVIHPSFIISRYMPLSSLQSALELASQGDHTKIIMTID